MPQIFKIFTGPMKSGKSTHLLQYISKYKYSGQELIYIFPERDNRFIQGPSRTGIPLFGIPKYPLKLLDFNPNSVCKNIEKYNTIIIDEMHLFDSELLFKVIDKLIKDKKNIIGACLNADYNQATFSILSMIFPHLTSIVNLSAFCDYCKKPAIYTIKTGGDKSKLIEIGDSIYNVCCGDCLRKSKKEV